MRRTNHLVALSCLALVGSAVAASPAPAVSVPGAGWQVQVLSNTASCETMLARIRAKGTLSVLPFGTKPSDRFYFDKELRYDKEPNPGTFRNLDFRKYDSSRFGPADLPMSTTLADKTVLPGYLFDSGIPVSVKLVTTLRKVRTGPDKKVWRDERRVYVPTNCLNGTPSN